jgi:hypothetical protein
MCVEKGHMRVFALIFCLFLVSCGPPHKSDVVLKPDPRPQSRIFVMNYDVIKELKIGEGYWESNYRFFRVKNGYIVSEYERGTVFIPLDQL